MSCIASARCAARFTIRAASRTRKKRAAPGDDGRFLLYDDNGATYNFRRGAFTRIRCEWRDRRRELVLALENAPPGRLQREFEIRMASQVNVRKVVLGREPVVVRF